jgi:methionyl-tRNA formyltransferase
MTRVIFMGTPQFAVPSLAVLADAPGFDVVAVVTQPDAPSGRGKALAMSPVKQFALAREIPVLQPESLKPQDAVDALRAYAPELIVVAAFGQILRKNVLEMPKFQCINVHASLLPRWRGAAPISAAIAAGDASAGVTIMLMEAGLDSGPMLSQRALPIGSEDTTGALTESLARVGAGLLIETLPGWVSGALTPRVQDESQVTFAGRIQKEQGRIDWSQPAAHVERHIRAMSPWPSAFTTLQGKQLKILRAALATTNLPAKPAIGAIVVDRNQVYAQCADGPLQMLAVQLEGKRAMPADVFARGHAGLDGAVLG